MSNSTTPPDVRLALAREFLGELQAWIAELARDERALILRGNYRFAADVGRMAKRARHVLDVLSA